MLERHGLRLLVDVLADPNRKPWPAACREADEREAAGEGKAKGSGRAKGKPAAEPPEITRLKDALDRLEKLTA